MYSSDQIYLQSNFTCGEYKPSGFEGNSNLKSQRRRIPNRFVLANTLTNKFDTLTQKKNVTFTFSRY